MKKGFVLLLTMVMAFSLCACEQGLATLEKLDDVELPPLPEVTEEVTPAPEEQAPEASEAPAAEQPADYEELDLANRVCVNIGRTAYTEYDPQNGSQLILNFSYETPRVQIEGRPEAAQAINDYLAMLDETFYTGNDYGAGSSMGYNMLLELAQDNYSYAVNSGTEMSLEYSDTRSASIARVDSAVLSILYNEASYTGGAHGNYGSRGYVFDVETGARLSLEDLSGDAAALSSFLVDYMVNTVESDESYAQRIDLMELTEGAGYADVLSPLLRDGSWYLSGEGLVIFSDLYEISSYAAGPVSFTIPYAELDGVLDAKWLPQDKPGEGRFVISPMDQVEDGTVEIIDLVSDGREGESFCLRCEGTVQDVKISAGQYTDVFYETSALWYASHMSGCAVQLEARLPDGLPELMISYTSGGEPHSVLLTRGEDGGPALAENVEAVG